MFRGHYSDLMRRYGASIAPRPNSELLKHLCTFAADYWSEIDEYNISCISMFLFSKLSNSSAWLIFHVKQTDSQAHNTGVCGGGWIQKCVKNIPTIPLLIVLLKCL